MTTLHSDWESVMLPNYGTPNVLLSHGEGCWLWDVQGNKYLDLIGGIAVSVLGHSDVRLVDAISTQAQKLLHTSNLYAHQPGLDLASELLQRSGIDGRVFFGQDGATVNEAALKLIRKFGNTSKRQTIIAMTGSFHGRTMGALAVTSNPTKRLPFAPFGIEVKFVEYGNIDQVRNAIDKSVVAIVAEPIQGESGLQVPPAGFLQDLRGICDEYGLILWIDEVQSAFGRSGYWFMSTAQGVKPDILTLAKGIAGGLPLGAMLVAANMSDVFVPGDHGSTFGGNPVSCAAALAVIEALETDDLVAKSLSLGSWLHSEIMKLQRKEISEVRGSGLWLAVQFENDISARVESRLRAKGILVNAVTPSAIRLAPPLVIEKAELQLFVESLENVLQELAA